MAIKVTLSPDADFSAADLFAAIDYLATEGTFLGFSTTLITGSGTFDSSAISFSLTGTDFGLTDIDGEFYLTSGMLQGVIFDASVAGSGVITFENVDIDMAVFAPIIAADDSGAEQFAIENFMMGRAWDITLGNQDDTVEFGMLIGDGAPLNLTQNDIIRGMGGNDRLDSGDGNDKLFGNSGADILYGGEGKDLLKGGNGADRLYGEGGRDRLFGDKGKDALFGGKKNDVLDGGAGNDTLKGGAGDDRFVFKDGSGRDKVLDFNVASDNEVIDLRQLTTIDDFAELEGFLNQNNNNAVINDGAGVKIILVGVDMENLSAGDFLF